MSTEKETMSQVKRRVKRITRNHKLYFRERGRAIRRLDKLSKSIYGNILVAFIKGDADKHYSKLNEKVSSWKEFQPIAMNIHSEEQEDFKRLKKAAGTDPVIISYNGSWQPLVNLGGFNPPKVSEESPVEELVEVE